MVLATTANADHELVGRNIQAGQNLYVTNCASCHGLNLEGQPNWRSPKGDGILPAPPHNATGHTWHYDNVLLFEYTKFGGQGAIKAIGITDFNSGMPAFRNVILGHDIWDVLAYIRSTWPERNQKNQAGRNLSH
mgnify:CR=1 FL=1